MDGMSKPSRVRVIGFWVCGGSQVWLRVAAFLMIPGQPDSITDSVVDSGLGFERKILPPVKAQDYLADSFRTSQGGPGRLFPVEAVRIPAGKPIGIPGRDIVQVELSGIVHKAFRRLDEGARFGEQLNR
jgi:hypothetical protein